MNPRPKALQAMISSMLGVRFDRKDDQASATPKHPSHLKIHLASQFFAALLALFVATDISYAQDAADKNDKQASLESAANVFVNQLAQGEFDLATKNFDTTMTAALAPGQLKAIWESLLKSVGKFDKPTRVHYQPGDVYDIVFVTCKFANASLDTKVVFDQQRRITGLFFQPVANRQEYRLPEYVNSNSFDETEIKFGDQPWTLAGTLGRPKGDAKAPAIILVHGSGPNDRDESVGANKPFKDLAGGLASRGIAVLRYEKRTKTHGAKMPKDLTVQEETIDDVIAAASWLSQQGGIDSARIFVLGHSLGGYLVPRIAKSDKEGRIAGYVIMAGNTRPLEELIREQTSYILGIDGEISDDEKATIDEIARQSEQVKSIASAAAPGPVFGAGPEYWLDLDGYRPQDEAKAISQPILVLQGERDYQVTMQDFSNWKSALGDRKSVQWKSYPRLNHLLIDGSGASSPAEYDVAGHVSVEVIQDIEAWVKQH